MVPVRSKRVRRTVEDSRASILEVAERHLSEDGPAGVKVQKIGRELGLSDAAIHYHFGSRDGLLEALLIYSGQRFVRDLATASQDVGPVDVQQASHLLNDLYGRRGAARLAAWLIQSGWTPPGSGMLLDLCKRLHDQRAGQAESAGERPDNLEDTQKLVAVLSALAFTNAIVGDALFRSVGLGGMTADELTSWVTDRLGAAHGGG